MTLFEVLVLVLLVLLVLILMLIYFSIDEIRDTFREIKSQNNIIESYLERCSSNTDLIYNSTITSTIKLIGKLDAMDESIDNILDCYIDIHSDHFMSDIKSKED